MTYYILNRQDGTQICCDYISEITENVLYKGTKQEFENLGFNEGQVGGFELVDGVLTFNKALFDKNEALKVENAKPIASGEELAKFLSKTKVESLTDKKALQMILKLAPFFSFLKMGRCNPLSEETLQSGIDKAMLTTIGLTKSEQSILLNLIENWKKTVRFIA